MQAGPADSKARSEYNLPTTADYYKRFTNANTFISNNANPFLISPYSPNQVNGSNNQTIFYVNTIKPLTPSGTIQIQGNVNIQNPYSLLINNNKVFTNEIYQYPNILGGFPTSVVCDATTETIKFNIGGPFSVTPVVIDNAGIHVNGFDFLGTTVPGGPIAFNPDGYLLFTIAGSTPIKVPYFL
jgi:hypothetical protein